MLEIPEWLKLVLERDNYTCPSCFIQADPAGVISIGIINADHKEKGNRTMLYTDYICVRCGQKVYFQIDDMTLEELGTTITTGIYHKPIAPVNPDDANIFKKTETPVTHNDMAKMPSKSKITAAEQKSIVKALDDVDMWHNWISMDNKKGFKTENE